jgi:hypothetical protein
MDCPRCGQRYGSDKRHTCPNEERGFSLGSSAFDPLDALLDAKPGPFVGRFQVLLLLVKLVTFPGRLVRNFILDVADGYEEITRFDEEELWLASPGDVSRVHAHLFARQMVVANAVSLLFAVIATLVSLASVCTSSVIVSIGFWAAMTVGMYAFPAAFNARMFLKDAFSTGWANALKYGPLALFVVVVSHLKILFAHALAGAMLGFIAGGIVMAIPVNGQPLYNIVAP